MRPKRSSCSTLVAACIHIFGHTVLHALGVNGSSSREFWEHLIIVVSITVPAIGAAVHGIGTQRQFRRQSERYHRMEGLLTQIQHEMDGATTLERVREAAPLRPNSSCARKTATGSVSCDSTTSS